MIRHTVMFTWKPEATDAQKKQVAEELSRLPGLVPSIRAYAMGTDIGVNDGNWDFAASGRLRRPRRATCLPRRPTHKAIIAEHIQPIIATRAAVQFEY